MLKNKLVKKSYISGETLNLKRNTYGLRVSGEWDTFKRNNYEK
jgi:hypothetical protein